MASELSKRLTSAIAKYLAPTLSSIGLSEMAYPERVAVGLVARCLGRPLAAGGVFYVTCWCDGGTAHNLTWRADVFDGSIWRDLQLTFPFERVGYPPAKPLGGSHTCLKDFCPDRNPANLDRAIQFLATLIVSHHQEIAAQVPELSSDIETALLTPEWRHAIQIAPELWARRFVQGDVDPGECEGIITFASATMLVVTAGDERITFRYPVELIDHDAPVYLSDWWTSPAGTRTAARLRMGSKSWQFDFFGRLKSTS